MTATTDTKTGTPKVALITGAGRGIGRATALRLARAGYSVGLMARSREQLEETADGVREAGSRAAIAVCDVRSADGVREAVNAIVSELGPVQVLVNNAGRGGGGVTAKMEDDLWREVVDTNLNSVFYVTKAVLTGNSGSTLKSIISTASTGGKQGVIYAAAYSASKHGVIGFTRSLALELAPQGITVNAVCPGFVETDLAGHARRSYARLWGVDEDGARKRIEQRVPLGRYIQPEEVAEMVAYLASAGAQGITGQAFNVCGGLGNY